MSEPTKAAEAFKLLSTPWPVKCNQCQKEFCKSPLIAVALGAAPGTCPDCSLRILKACETPPTNLGCTIHIPIVGKK